MTPRSGTHRPAVVAAAAPVPELMAALAAALAGTGPPLLPVTTGHPASRAVLDAAQPGAALAPGTALLLATSGSTGAPKVVELGADALLASAGASQERLGGPAQWVLALPLVHVAGWQVLLRSVEAGTAPVALPAGAPFTAAAFTAAAGALTAPRRATALVPTQLARVLADPGATAAAAGLDAVLVGGAATSPALLDAARAAGVPVVTTYGGTETCGGCVYDGVPLAGVRVAVTEGLVELAGPVLASGYRGRPDLTAQAFPERAGQRWYRTQDAGALAAGALGRPVLRVLGRADDVLVTGGEKVAPPAVEAVLAAVAGVREALVVGVPDPQWGQAVVALVVPAPAGEPTLEDVRAAVRGQLGPASAPRALLLVDALPSRALGKPDRAAAATLAARLLGVEPGPREGAPGASPGSR